MVDQDQREQIRLHEALKQYVVFLETRGISSRTETISVTGALGRVSASAAYAQTPCMVPPQQVCSGEGFAAGEMLLQSYLEITPAVIAALLSGGVRSVSVLSKPSVGIIFAGFAPAIDAAGARWNAAFEPSAALYCAMLTRWGAEGIAYFDAGCEPDTLRSVLLRAAKERDLVLLCTEATQGIPADVLNPLVEVCVDGIAIHPGGDILLGAIEAVPIICTSSDPSSGIVVLEELVKPLLDRLLMRERDVAESVCVKMGSAYASAPEVREFVPAKLGFDPEGSLVVLPIPAGKNGIETLIEADCILDVPQNCAGYAAGARAHMRLLKPIDRIARTVRICGCHDPFLNEAADALRRADIRAYVSSERAGNEDAMLALRRGECHLASICLPDETDSVSYIEQRLPAGGMALVEGVRRVQAAFITSENPLSGQAYDLLVLLTAMENPQVRAFLRVLGSELFLRRLDALGGYRYDKPGRIKKIWPGKEHEPETEPKTGQET